MISHLKDEELLECLSNEAGDTASAHLESCEQCRQEAERLRAQVTRIARTIKHEAARAEAKAREDAFAARAGAFQTPRPWRWVLALSAALTIAGLAILFVTPAGRNWAVHHNTLAKQEPIVAGNAGGPGQPPLRSGEPASPSRTQQESDDLLLQEITEATERDMPDALQPVTLIVAEHNASSNEIIPIQGGY